VFACGPDETPTGSGTEGSNTTDATTTDPTPMSMSMSVDDTGPMTVSASADGSSDGSSSSSGPPPVDGTSSSDDGMTTTTTDASTSTTDPTTSSTTETSGTTDPTDPTSTGGMTDPTGMTDGMTTDPSGSTTVGPEPLPDGSQCSDPAQCESGNCYDAGVLGGVCGECDEDADCPDGGCSIPNPLDGTPPFCNDGSLGGGCETDDVCDDPLLCSTIFDVPGVILLATCSECVDDIDCGNGDLCAPTFDVGQFEGYETCVAPGSVPDAGGCDLEGSGDAQCASGFCGAADVQGLLQVGICGECLVDDDCGPGEICMPPEVDFALGATGATCV